MPPPSSLFSWENESMNDFVLFSFLPPFFQYPAYSMDLRQPPLSARPSVKSLRGKVVRVPKKSLKSAHKATKKKCKECRIIKHAEVMVLKLKR